MSDTESLVDLSIGLSYSTAVCPKKEWLNLIFLFSLDFYKRFDLLPRGR